MCGRYWHEHREPRPGHSRPGQGGGGRRRRILQPGPPLTQVVDLSTRHILVTQEL